MYSDSVSWTNDDAASAKLSAIQLNYWQDDHVGEFVSHGHSTRRRTPEINRGYWARVVAVEHFVKKFLQIHGNQSQIVNLGAGFDTLFWKLTNQNIEFKCVVDVDLASVTSQKLHAICKSEKLTCSLEDISHSETELHSEKYHLIEGDLRRGHALVNKLKKDCSIDVKAPTLFIAECVLVYLRLNETDSLLTALSSVFSCAAFILYEPVQANDPFTAVMKDNLRQKNCELAGVCDINEQEERFIRNGWSGGVRAYDMWTVYSSLLDRNQVNRIERIEFLDERELLSQLLCHYCFVVAISSKQMENFLNW